MYFLDKNLISDFGKNLVYNKLNRKKLIKYTLKSGKQNFSEYKSIYFFKFIQSGADSLLNVELKIRPK